MAMIKCPDCKSPISDSAESCPRCGSTYHKTVLRLIQQKKNLIEGIERQSVPSAKQVDESGFILFGLVVLGLVVASIFLKMAWLFFFSCALCSLTPLFLIKNGCQESSNKKAHDEAMDRYNRAKASLPQHRRELSELEAKIR